MSARPRKEVTPDTFAGRFGIRLRELREKKKMTVEELSEITGIPHQTICRWENGDRCPVNEQVFLLADALKIKSSRLLEDPKK